MQKFIKMPSTKTYNSYKYTSTRFHLAILAGNLPKAIEFYCDVLGCARGNSEDNARDSWCDINFWGNELTLHASESKITKVRHAVDMGDVLVPHFGVHLDAEEFANLKKRFKRTTPKFIDGPYIRFKGKPLEQETMFIEDPNGNILEIKTMKNPETLFQLN
jgi:extradiol dioxygenase family protein